MTKRVLGDDVRHLRCSYHLLHLDLGPRLSGIACRDEITTFINTRLQEAPSEKAFDDAWAEFKQRFSQHTRLIDYMQKMLIGRRETWARPWRDLVLHGEWTSTQAAESLNSAVKRSFMMQRARYMNIPVIAKKSIYTSSDAEVVHSSACFMSCRGRILVR